MSDDGIPEDVRAFIGEHIDSVEQLEVLLLLRRAPTRWWSAADVSRELYVAEESAARRLASFHDRGLLERREEDSVPLYRYRPARAELDRTIHDLAAVYEERRVRVINLIFSKPIDTVRSFADAFIIRKKEE